jgi:sterol desaturase/sphingolipid hydroxylase (fatty acid hydroxylase superfamily)
MAPGDRTEAEGGTVNEAVGSLLVAIAHEVLAALRRLQHVEVSWTLFLAPVVLIFLLERAIPAHRARRLLSLETAQDAIWFSVETLMRATLYFYVAGALVSAHERWFGGFSLDATQGWPVPLRALLGVMVYDLVLYVHHVAHHRLSWLWPFHAVHHSQVHLNLFTAARFHVVEKLLARAMIFLPLVCLELTQTETFLTAWLVAWHARFSHGNIRTGLGPLWYVIVTPQSHRVHHSIEARHRDRNFTTHFPIWDMVFGTQYWGRNEYPETGIEDPRFPLERPGWWLLATPIAQTLYPFRQLLARNP